MTAQVHESLIIDGEMTSMAFCPPLPIGKNRFGLSLLISFICAYVVMFYTASYLICFISMAISFYISHLFLRVKKHPRVNNYEPKLIKLDFPEITVISQDLRGEKLVLKGPKITIGRDQNNSCTLNHDSISSEHCQLIKTDDGYLLKDMSSLNGIRVNGIKKDEQLLSNDDLITLGDVELLYKTEKSEHVMSTACWRQYIGTWEIRDEKFYLTKLTGTYTIEGTEPIFAEWFSGTLRVPEGELLKYVHMGFGSVYEEELHIEIKNGKVINSKTLDNRNKKFNRNKLALKNLPGFENRFNRD